MKTIVTNNPLVNQSNNNLKLLYLAEKDYLDVLIKARELIHNNYHLLTHPLAGNFLADKTFYKTIVLEENENIDVQSIEIIENAVILVRNSIIRRDKRIYDSNIKTDLQFIDYEIIKQALLK